MKFVGIIQKYECEKAWGFIWKYEKLELRFMKVLRL
jgi:hypothetical protein